MNSFQDCYFHCKDNQLTIGNARIERVWDLTRHIPASLSLLDKSTGEQWLNPSQPVPMFRFPFLTDCKLIGYRLESSSDNDLAIANIHLKLDLQLMYDRYDVLLTTRIYPDQAFMQHEILVKLANRGGSEETALDTATYTVPELLLDNNNKDASHSPSHYVDSLPFRERHNRWSSVTLRDVTDHNNNLVSEDSGLFYINEKRDLSAGALFVRNPFHDHGLFFLKESPTPIAQLHYPGHDYHFRGQHVFMTGSGLEEADLQTDHYLPAYGSVVGVGTNGEVGLLKVLHDYHASIRSFPPDRDCFVMSNTWGDRSRDARVSEAFLLQELETAAQMGVSIVQIDDGWQQGATVGSIVPGGVWSGYYEHQDDFWQVHRDRFPNGLEPIVSRARQLGVKLGLWFSPDSSEHFANWEKDAATVLHYYNEHGIRHFKLDAIHIRSKAGEVNVLRMMREVIRQSGAAVCFNLDTTAQIRLGYYGRNQYGSLFLENRYTDFLSYYPHYTLRNLWMLSRYVPVRKLQMEFLNVDRNVERYGDDPLAPVRCGFAYSFGVTMASTPLAWMELSGLGEHNKELLAKMLPAYRYVQANILGGTVLPIGTEPSGFGWTGFQSLAASGRDGWLVIYRENSAQDTYAFSLWESAQQFLDVDCMLRWEAGTWSGDGLHPVYTERLQPDSTGQYTFRFSQPFSFAVFRYRE